MRLWMSYKAFNFSSLTFLSLKFAAAEVSFRFFASVIFFSLKFWNSSTSLRTLSTSSSQYKFSLKAFYLSCAILKLSDSRVIIFLCMSWSNDFVSASYLHLRVYEFLIYWTSLKRSSRCYYMAWICSDSCLLCEHSFIHLVFSFSSLSISSPKALFTSLASKEDFYHIFYIYLFWVLNF